MNRSTKNSDALRAAAIKARRHLAGPVNSILSHTGFEVSRLRRPISDDADLLGAFVVTTVAPFTMTPPERIMALVDALRYITKNAIPGAILECGVWKGGSMMAAAQTLRLINAADRELYLFDTFDGMTPPTDADVDLFGDDAASVMKLLPKEGSPVWAYSPEAEVRANMASTGYPSQLVHFVRGSVMDTLPQQAPERIALLRLDTDFYDSTKHELETLVSRVSPGGVLIIDDYGHWRGSRKATDEFFDHYPFPVLLQRVDYAARLAIL